MPSKPSREFIERIRYAITEEEQVALKAWRGDGWRHEAEPDRTLPGTCTDEVWTGRRAPGHTPIPIAKAWNPPTAEHIARQDPGRVLRGVAAMRKMLDRLELVLTTGDDLKDERGVLISVPIARRHAREMVKDLAEAYGIEP